MYQDSEKDRANLTASWQRLELNKTPFAAGTNEVVITDFSDTDTVRAFVVAECIACIPRGKRTGILHIEDALAGKLGPVLDVLTQHFPPEEHSIVLVGGTDPRMQQSKSDFLAYDLKHNLEALGYKIEGIDLMGDGVSSRDIEVGQDRVVVQAYSEVAMAFTEDEGRREYRNGDWTLDWPEPMADARRFEGQVTRYSASKGSLEELGAGTHKVGLSQQRVTTLS